MRIAEPGERRYGAPGGDRPALVAQRAHGRELVGDRDPQVDAARRRRGVDQLASASRALAVDLGRAGDDGVVPQPDGEPLDEAADPARGRATGGPRPARASSRRRPRRPAGGRDRATSRPSARPPSARGRRPACATACRRRARGGRPRSRARRPASTARSSFARAASNADAARVVPARRDHHGARRARRRSASGIIPRSSTATGTSRRPSARARSSTPGPARVLDGHGVAGSEVGAEDALDRVERTVERGHARRRHAVRDERRGRRPRRARAAPARRRTAAAAPSIGAGRQPGPAAAPGPGCRSRGRAPRRAPRAKSNRGARGGRSATRSPLRGRETTTPAPPQVGDRRRDRRRAHPERAGHAPHRRQRLARPQLAGARSPPPRSRAISLAPEPCG